MTDSSPNLFLLALGYLAGLMGPIVVFEIKRQRNINNLQPSIITELSELRYRLASEVFIVVDHLGDGDLNFYKWLYNILKKYQGRYASKSLTDSIGKLIKQSPAKIAAYVKQAASTGGAGLSIRKHRMPIYESNSVLIASFETIFQNNLSAIANHLDILNEIVEESIYFHRLTFVSKTDPIILANAIAARDSHYQHFASQAKHIGCLPTQ